MGKLLRSSLAFGAIVFVLMGASYAFPNWAARSGADWRSLSNLLSGLEEGLRQNEELDRRLAVTEQCNAGRQEVVADLIAGRISLLQAAVRFGCLNQRLPESGVAYRYAYPGNSEAERLCRYVIAYTRTTLIDESPELAATMVELLNAELRQLLEADGTVQMSGE
jgi:hypothetical protein